MGSRRVYSQVTADIIDRFYAAADAAVENGLVKNVNQLCIAIGIERPHFYMQRKDRDRGYFQVGWLAPMVEKYGFSPSWLLTGRGTMFLQ